MELITLRAGGAAVALAPALGGAVTRYWTEDGRGPHDWLRPTPADALARGDPYELAAFPLVPFSNRIRAGAFRFEGRRVRLPLNRPGEPHAIHGHGWQQPWQAVDVRPDRARLEYRHGAGDWPWPYRASQEIALAPGRLTVALALTNEGDEAMPAGLGWHPYFPRTPETTLTAGVRALWLTDAGMMPTALVPPSPAADLARGVRADATPLDNGFAGWDGRAVLEWPEHRARLVMTAGPPLEVLVVYTPAGRPFLCVEPVSHVTDAVNLAAAGRADTGLRHLPPGATLRAAVTLAPEA
jgi:aldose 1-epimerase